MKKKRPTKVIADLRYYQTLKKISRFLNKHIYLLMTTFTVLTLITFGAGNWNSAYLDADGYMRALRVYHWILNPSFYEQTITESNYPFGEIIHWTRPIDILWLVNTLPFLTMSNLKDIIFISGAFVSPWLAVITTLLLIYGLRHQFNIYLTIFGCFLFLCNPTLQSYFSSYRPDHHSLMILLTTYAFSLCLCWLKKRHTRYLRLLGIALALCVFTAVEGIIIYALFLGFFLFLYIFKNIALLPSVKTAKYFAYSLTIFWLLNPPLQGWFYPDNGRISILFVTLSWLIYIALYGLDLSHLHTRIIKLYGIILASLGCATFLLLIFGTNIYQFPLNDEINNTWGFRISEMYPLWENPLPNIIAYYFFPAISLLLNFKLLKLKHYKRLMTLNLCLGAPLFILSIFASRFLNYQNLYTIIPFLCCIESMYKNSTFYKQRTGDFPSKIWLACISFLLLQQLAEMPYALTLKDNTPTKTFSASTCQKIQSIGGTLLTDIFHSPEYIWKCNITTIGTPYHRNQEGIIDNHNILYQTNDNELIPLLLKHQIRQILLFDAYDNKYYNMSKTNKDKLYYRLIKRENIPSFLKEIPSDIVTFRHFQIKL